MYFTIFSLKCFRIIFR